MTTPCPQCRGNKIVKIVFAGINRPGQTVCGVCLGTGTASKLRPLRQAVKARTRIVKEGPRPD